MKVAPGRYLVTFEAFKKLEIQCAVCHSMVSEQQIEEIVVCKFCEKVTDGYLEGTRKRIIKMLHQLEFGHIDKTTKLIREYLWEAKQLSVLSKSCPIDEELMMEPWAKYYVEGEHEYEWMREGKRHCTDNKSGS